MNKLKKKTYNESWEPRYEINISTDIEIIQGDGAFVFDICGADLIISLMNIAYRHPLFLEKVFTAYALDKKNGLRSLLQEYR